VAGLEDGHAEHAKVRTPELHRFLRGTHVLHAFDFEDIAAGQLRPGRPAGQRGVAGATDEIQESGFACAGVVDRVVDEQAAVGFMADAKDVISTVPGNVHDLSSTYRSATSQQFLILTFH